MPKFGYCNKANDTTQRVIRYVHPYGVTSPNPHNQRKIITDTSPVNKFLAFGRALESLLCSLSTIKFSYHVALSCLEVLIAVGRHKHDTYTIRLEVSMTWYLERHDANTIVRFV